MVLSDTGRYLDRMPNGYVPELAKALGGDPQPASQALSAGEAVPADYRHQRFVLAVPCARFHQEFHLPGAELRHLARRIAASPSHFLEGRPHPSFPYLRARDGSFVIPGTGAKVVVIGDYPPGRTFDLAAQGHHPINVQATDNYLSYSEKLIAAAASKERQAGRLKRNLHIDWVYETDEAQGDYVEAYFPIETYQLSRNKAQRMGHIYSLLDTVLGPRLSPRGKGVFVLLDYPKFAEEMAGYIRGMPEYYELLEVGHFQEGMGGPVVPLRGGYSHEGRPFSSATSSHETLSWLVYRPRKR
jgi:hypothetical protein